VGNSLDSLGHSFDKGSEGEKRQGGICLTSTNNVLVSKKRLVVSTPLVLAIGSLGVALCLI